MEDPTECRNLARKIRDDAAEAEFQVPVPPHPNNGDRELY